MQAVEPTSCLVHRLADVIGREAAVCVDGLVVEGVVILGEGHGSRVEPGVHNLGDTVHLAGAALGGAVEDDVVDVGTVQVQAVNGQASVGPGHAPQLIDAADAYGVVTVLALPDGDGRAPVAFT